MAQTRPRDPRAATNPLFGERRLKLGTFSTNLDYGCAMSSIDGVLRISWANTLRLAQIADEMAFEALVPVGRWKGFDGKLDFNGAGFEAFSWAAGVGASTRYPAVFSTAHMTTIHPLMAAKQATTIDHITGGRFALNLVTGWNKTEMEMFGSELPDHDTRYAMAAEWLTVMKRLWSEPEPVDFAGQYYTLKGAIVRPQPIQRPYPAVMCAGASPAGMEFSARHCDVAFVHGRVDDPDGTRRAVEAYRALARDTYGRDLQIWCHAYVVTADTEREARDFLRYYVDENGDWEGAENLIASLVPGGNFPPDTLHAMKRHLIAGWAGYPMVGSREQVVDEMLKLSMSVGVDGLLLSFARYESELEDFRDKTLPMLVQAGLR